MCMSITSHVQFLAFRRAINNKLWLYWITVTLSCFVGKLVRVSLLILTILYCGVEDQHEPIFRCFFFSIWEGRVSNVSFWGGGKALTWLCFDLCLAALWIGMTFIATCLSDWLLKWSHLAATATAPHNRRARPQPIRTIQHKSAGENRFQLQTVCVHTERHPWLDRAGGERERSGSGRTEIAVFYFTSVF